MKRKTLTLTLSLLVCFALIGVGYASWIITNTNTSDLEGNIVIDSVEDKRLTVVYEWVTDSTGTILLDDGDETKNDEGKVSPTLAYGMKTGVTGAPTWLSNDANTENLSAYLKVTVTDKSGNPVDANVVSSLSVSNATKWDNAVTEGLIGNVPTIDEASKISTGVYVVSFTLTWGKRFGNVNPMQFFKDKNLNDTLPSLPEGVTETQYTTCGDYAAHYLQTLEDAFKTNNAKDEIKYTLHIAVTAI